MHRSTLSTVVALLAAVSVSACGDSTGTGQTGTTNSISTADVAAGAASQANSDVDLLIASQDVGASQSPSGCTYSSGTQQFDCTGAATGTLSVTRSYTLFDAAGSTQSQYDAATTASIDFLLGASGTATGTTFSATVDRDAELTVSGLAGTETQRTWNGAGTGALQVEFQGQSGTRAYEMTSADTVDGVVFRLPTTSYPYPQAGRIIRRYAVTQTMEAGQPVSRTAARRVVVTFNGTESVPLRVGVVDCVLNLRTKAVVCGQAQ